MLHTHVYEPLVLLHVALRSLQGFATAHSFMSSHISVDALVFGVYPREQLQVYEPLVLMHDVRVGQACAPRTHSSVSVMYVCIYACAYVCGVYEPLVLMHAPLARSRLYL